MKLVAVSFGVSRGWKEGLMGKSGEGREEQPGGKRPGCGRETEEESR